MKKIFNIKKILSIALVVLCTFFVATDCFASAAQKCIPYNRYETRDMCIFCPVVAVAFNTVSKVGDNAVSSYANSVAKVVIVGFAIWLAIQILSFVSSIETRDLKDLLQSILTKGFVILISVFIIKTGIANFLDTFVVPIYSTGHRMAQSLFETDADANLIKNIREKAATIILDKKSVPSGLPQDMGITILQTMTQMENQILKYKALGSGFLCQSWVDKWFIIPKIRYLLIGIVLWATAIVLMAAIPFLLIDSVFQLGIATALMPVAVGSFAFKSTRQYSKKVWDTLLNSMFTFLFVCIIVMILLTMLQQLAGGGRISTGATFEDMYNPQTWYSKGDEYFTHMLDNFTWGGTTFLKLIFFYILAWSVMNMGKEFAKEFAESISSTSIGSNVATMGASAIKGTALGITRPVVKSVVGGFQKGVARVARGIRHGTRRRAMNKQMKKFDNPKNNVTEVNGVKTYTDKKGRIHTLENGAITTVKKGKNGKETIMVRSKDITVTRTKDKNGNWKERIKLNNDKIHSIVRPDGSVDTAAFASMFEGVSGEQEKVLKAAMVKMIVQKRIPNGYDRKQKLSSPPEIIKSENGEMILREVTKDGDVVFTKVKLNSNGVLETSITEVSNRGGRVRTMTSDGYRNSLTIGQLNQNVSQDDLTSIDAVNAHTDQKNKKTVYGISKFYKERVDRGWLRVEDVAAGMYEGIKQSFEKQHNWWEDPNTDPDNPDNIEEVDLITIINNEIKKPPPSTQYERSLLDSIF